MGLLEVLFLLYTTFPNVHASDVNLCPGSNCGDLYIDYPFKLQNTQPQGISCTYIELNCDVCLINATETAIISLPDAGYFDVSDIFYGDPYIKLSDPGNCLMRRLMENTNVSWSPLKAISYENYTFYTCPSNAGLRIKEEYFWAISCLSNTTNSTVATAIATPAYMLSHGCQLIGSWMLPVLVKGQFEFEGINGDLYLTWDTSISCLACEDHQGDKGGSDGLHWDTIASSPIFLPSFVTAVMLIIVCIASIIKCIIGTNESSSDDGLQPSEATARGLDESKINACTELMILNENIIASSDTGSCTCSICLESYRPQELVRSIPRCGHYFHAHCIQEWLIKSTTCPVCRTGLLDNGL